MTDVEKKSGWATLSGDVFYRQRIALRPGGLLTVQLQDVSRADAAADTLASSTSVTGGSNVPIPFTLTYDASAIQENRSYAVRATVHYGDKLAWTSTTSVGVLTRDFPDDGVSIMLEQVG